MYWPTIRDTNSKFFKTQLHPLHEKRHIQLLALAWPYPQHSITSWPEPAATTAALQHPMPSADVPETHLYPP